MPVFPSKKFSSSLLPSLSKKRRGDGLRLTNNTIYELLYRRDIVNSSYDFTARENTSLGVPAVIALLLPFSADIRENIL